MPSDAKVIPVSDFSPAEIAEAVRASRAASRTLARVSLSDVGRTAAAMGGAAMVVQQKSVDTAVTAEVTHGVVGAEELEAARQLSERMSGRVSREQLDKQRELYEREQQRQRDAYIAVQKSPRNHAERRLARQNPNWTRDGVSLDYLGVAMKPKGTKSPKPPKRKRKKKQ